MSALDTISERQKEILISLPYRVGLWVSQSDETGGTESGEQELQVLSNIIDGFTHEVFGSELMQVIMSGTVNNKDQWNSWSEKVADVPEDCALAVDVLAQHAGEKDVHAFQVEMMEIGEAVALAFREYEHLGPIEKFGHYISYYLTPTKGKTLDEYLSISRAERQALIKLAESLGTTYI